MFARLLALFICIPLIELALLIQIGEWVGLGPTIVLVIVTGVIGASLAQRQGFKVWTKIQAELQSGRMPTTELVDGLLILVGGVVLLTPGLLTDLLGFALMIPAVRRLVRAHLNRRFQLKAAGYRPRPRPEENVIDI